MNKRRLTGNMFTEPAKRARKEKKVKEMPLWSIHATYHQLRTKETIHEPIVKQWPVTYRSNGRKL
jgi:hypothetical protein